MGIRRFLGILALTILLSSPVLAVDFSQYSTEELYQMRGTMRNAAEEEREAFRQEWQKRMREMSPEERRQYMGPPTNAPRDGSGFKYGQGQGKKGRGQGRCPRR